MLRKRDIRRSMRNKIRKLCLYLGQMRSSCGYTVAWEERGKSLDWKEPYRKAIPTKTAAPSPALIDRICSKLSPTKISSRPTLPYVLYPPYRPQIQPRTAHMI